MSGEEIFSASHEVLFQFEPKTKGWFKVQALLKKVLSLIFKFYIHCKLPVFLFKI